MYRPFEDSLQNLDGAAFGTTFAPALAMIYPSLSPGLKAMNIDPILDGSDEEDEELGPIYVSDYGLYSCKIYGFRFALFNARVSIFSKTGPRMAWLRQRGE